MYIPKDNQFDDFEQQIEFIKRFSFGTIITSVNNVPIATHLPFIVENINGKLSIISHFAKANDHWKHIVGQDSLIIFTEPHAYISPKHYEKTESVPTWNYMAIHVYGGANLITDDVSLFNLLEKSINFYEKDYKKQWDSLSKKFKTNMVRGIVGFEFKVKEIQAKKKLSQNKSISEKENIISNLKGSTSRHDQLVAEYMIKLQKILF